MIWFGGKIILTKSTLVSIIELDTSVDFYGKGNYDEFKKATNTGIYTR